MVQWQKNPPADAGDTRLNSGPRRPHILQRDEAVANTEPVFRDKSSPCLLLLEKAHTRQQGRSSTTEKASVSNCRVKALQRGDAAELSLKHDNSHTLRCPGC